MDASDAILVLDTDQRLCVFNRAAEELFGYSAGEVVGQRLDLLIPERFGELHRRQVEAFRHGSADRVPMSRRPEVAGRRRDGSEVPLEVTIARVEAGPEGSLLVAIARDATERRRREAELVDRALHDPLTGLANRAMLFDRLQHALTPKEAPGETGRDWVGVALVDLDDFKLVNDGLGHQAGDKVLVVTAERLRQASRPGDLVARYGGDEFVLAWTGLADPASGRSLASRVARLLSQPISCGGTKVYSTASVGLAYARAGEIDADTLIDRADAALYRAKGSGGSHHETFTDELRDDALSQLLTETDLHSAMDAGEMVVHYQPIVELTSGTTLALDALVRWQHPSKGLLRPAEFLPAAIHNGLIGSIDRFVLESACLALASQGPVWVPISLSGRREADSGLPGMIAGIIEGSSIDPRDVTIEIAESSLLGDRDHGAAVLDSLAALGVRIAIDSFGSGNASLSFLQRLPVVHALKVDSSFVAAAGRGPKAIAILRAVASLAGELGAQAVAEGVETAEQVRLLLELGFVHAQGSYFGEPGPLAAESRGPAGLVATGSLLRSTDWSGGPGVEAGSELVREEPERKHVGG